MLSGCRFGELNIRLANEAQVFAIFRLFLILVKRVARQ